ncbi:efflux transporter, RND family, MFP subunit [Verrucomicrobiia bacterium DG1235]|nr:efflux transporter, RND family, MFP subunit [Verrucomicrobiae bacterium DG1235]
MNDEFDRPPFFEWLCFYVLPPLVAVALLAGGILALAKKMQKPPELNEPVRVLPSVETMIAHSQAIKVEIETQGTVQALTQTTLIAEVSGRVESISPSLFAGGFFRKGDLLVQVDPIEYEAALASSKSRYAEAQLAYQQEKELADQAADDWKQMGNSAEPSELVLRKPQLARAKANLEAARAAVRIAERDLSRTRVLAPYDGRVQQKFIDIGQSINARSSQVATIYSVDAAEIRLPISSNQMRYIEIPETYRDGVSTTANTKVLIEASYGGKTYQWDGFLDRSEGAIDPQTRLLYVVARVNDPYARSESSDRPPLKVGTFVTAKIQGETIEDAFEIPRKALRENDTVYVVSDEERLEIRPVSVYQRGTEHALLTDGLKSGDRICLTPLQYVVDGMEVTIEGADSSDTDKLATNETAGNS